MSDSDSEHLRRELRETAERHLAEAAPEGLPEALRHELSVHQNELELQNEQLRSTLLDLQAAHDRYEALYEQAPVGYVSLDARGEIRSVNRQTVALLGAGAPRLLGRRLTQFVAPESRTSFAAWLPRRRSGADDRPAEVRLQRADGASFPVRLEGWPHASGVLLVALIDLSREKATQEELLRLNDALERRVEERTAKVRELSDELRNVASAVAENLMVPTKRVVSFARRLGRGGAPAPAGPDAADPSAVDALERSVARMEELAGALLEYTRVSSSRVRLTTVDLNRVVAEVHKDLRARTKGRDVRLASAPLPVVSGDAAALQQVFRRLLDNAVKFTAPREVAVVHVGAEETETEFVLRVEDNGVGFNNRSRGKLFVVFGRLHPDSAFPGTGVGLAIVRRICARFGGRVWAEGRPGEGATFFVAWPKQPTVLE